MSETVTRPESPPAPSRTNDELPMPLALAGDAGASRAAWRWLGFHPRAMPPIARGNYRRELAAALFIPFMLVAFEGTVISVLVRIAFEGTVNRPYLNVVTALLSVAPALANLSSAAWVSLAHGRDKVRFIVTLQRVMVLLCAAIALAPSTPFGLGLIAVAVLGARCCWAGILTIRSTVWHANYPDGTRGRIAGKLATVQVLLVATLALGLGQAMEAAEWWYRVLLGVGCVMALVGTWLWSGVRVRRHAALRRAERELTPRHGRGLGSLWRVLAHDRDFARFMTFQFLLGVGNITAGALLAIVLRERFGVSYKMGLAINTAIPMLCMPLSVPVWARLIDRSHVVHFRAIHSWVFVASLAALTAGIWRGQLWLVALAVLAKGIAAGGGALAWTLGHLDFAPPHHASRYMGVHVTLTGARGLISLVFGVSAYEALEAHTPGSGWVVFAICLVVTMLGACGFGWMSLHMRKTGYKPGLRHRDIEPTTQGAS